MAKQVKGQGFQGGKYADSRAKDFKDLDEVIDYSWGKVHLRNTKNSEAQSWCRVIINAIDTKETLRKNAELEDIELRLKTLEEASMK